MMCALRGTVNKEEMITKRRNRYNLFIFFIQPLFYLTYRHQLFFFVFFQLLFYLTYRHKLFYLFCSTFVLYDMYTGTTFFILLIQLFFFDIQAQPFEPSKVKCSYECHGWPNEKCKVTVKNKSLNHRPLTDFKHRQNFE